MSVLRIVAPLAGWCMPLAEVPDAVFAQGMAGDGMAIDPTGGTVHAPCDGELVVVRDARHAFTVRHGAIDVLVHVGIDTVALEGAGFEWLARAGERVTAGQPVLRLDLARLARAAPSLVTPVLLATGQPVVRRAAVGRIAVGDLLMQVAIGAAPVVEAPAAMGPKQRPLRVPFEHGLHVRPAAQVAAALKPFAAEVTLLLGANSANARSTVALMALGARRGDTVQARATGGDADAALDALQRLFGAHVPAAAAVPAVATQPTPATPPRGRIEGVSASPGLAFGKAALWTSGEVAISEDASDAQAQHRALEAALAAVRSALVDAAREARGEARMLLEAHAELVADPELLAQARAWVERGKSAAYAWRSATRATAEKLAALDDPRMRERAADLRDLEGQVVRVLSGKPAAASRDFGPDAIVLAEDLVPSAMMQLERQRVAGICIAAGGATSHVAILAAASGIPVLVATGTAILAIADGTPLLLDADAGCLEIEPPPMRRAAATRQLEQRASDRRAEIQGARQPARTADGVRIVVNANLGAAAEAAGALESGAEGCGLLRTEFLFLERSEPPTEDEQLREYQAIADALGGRPLSVRTMDVGGDKPLPYLPAPHEDNPALGLRGIRASLSRPELLRAQLRAIARVRPAGQCRVLLPMVTELDEVLQVRALLAECAREAGAPEPQLGVMIETPASAMLADQLVTAVDFFSIGTNDLSQYVLAIDRGHRELGRRLDALHPAVLRLIAQVADVARAHDKPVAVCGALAADAEALPLLVGLGVHELSVTPGAIPRVKRVLRMLDAEACARLAREAMQQSSAAAVRALAATSRSRSGAAASIPSIQGGSR